MKYACGIAPTPIIDWEHLVCSMVERRCDGGGNVLSVHPSFRPDVDGNSACGHALRESYSAKAWAEVAACGLVLGPFVARQDAQGNSSLQLVLPVEIPALGDASAYVVNLIRARRLPNNLSFDMFQL